MSRTPILLITSLILAAAIHAAAPSTSSDAGITLALEKIKETCMRVLEKTDDSDFGMFDTPGLELRFALRIPEGRQVVSIGQPTSLTAVDDVGADLSKLPKIGWGEPQHVQLISEWEKPPHALDFKLALPKRNATTFSLSAELEAVTYTDTVKTRIAPGREWMPLKDVFEADETIHVRVEQKPGAIHLAFKPGTVRESVESVAFYFDDRPANLESQGVMWNPQQVAFMFMGSLPKTGQVTAQIEVRRGLETAPLKIELKGIALP